MSGLVELAERIEQAEGPCRELDAAVFEAVDPAAYAKWLPEEQKRQKLDDAAGMAVYRPAYSLPPYTGSLDAAMTLVPERWRLSRLSEHIAPTPHAKAGLIYWYDGTEGKAATPALALCAAALRARGEA